MSLWRVTCMCGRTFGGSFINGEPVTLQVRRVNGQCIGHMIVPNEWVTGS